MQDSVPNRPRPLSDLIPGLTRQIYGRKSQLFGKLLTEWTQIAGAEVAAKTIPVELKFAGVKAKGGRTPLSNIHAIPPVGKATVRTGDSQAILHLAVQPAYALELSYQKSLLIERLNMFFGYAAIKDIRIVQDSEVMNNNPLPAPKTRPVTLQEERKIDALVAGIKENDLQTALKNLGKSIASRQDQP